MLNTKSLKNKIAILFSKDTDYYTWTIPSPAVTFCIPRDVASCTYVSGVQGSISTHRSKIDKSECDCIHSTRGGSLVYQKDTINYPFLPSLVGGVPPAFRLVSLDTHDKGDNNSYRWQIRTLEPYPGLRYIICICLADGDPLRDNAVAVSLYHSDTDDGGLVITSACYADLNNMSPSYLWSASEEDILDSITPSGATMLPKYLHLSQGVDAILLEHLANQIPWRLSRGLEYLRINPDDIDSSYSRASENAALNVDLLPINMLENLTDLFELQSLIPPPLTVKDWKVWMKHPHRSIKKLLKLFGSSWLYWSYVVLTSWSDMLEAYHAYQRFQSYLSKVMHGSITSRGQTYTTFDSMYGPLDAVVHCKLRIRTLDSISNTFLMGLRSIGLDVSGKRTYWDLIPLSFVLDWILNINKIAQAEDGQARLARYNVRSALYSYKISMDVTPSIDDERFPYLRGSIKEKYYHREVDSIVRVGMLPSVEVKVNTSQWITATALVIALTK